MKEEKHKKARRWENKIKKKVIAKNIPYKSLYLGRINYEHFHTFSIIHTK